MDFALYISMSRRLGSAVLPSILIVVDHWLLKKDTFILVWCQSQLFGVLIHSCKAVSLKVGLGFGTSQLGPEDNQHTVKKSKHYSSQEITQSWRWTCHGRAMAKVVFDAVADLTESSDDGGAAAEVDQFQPVTSLSEEDADDQGADSDVRYRNRKSFKRKRKQIAEAVRERLSSRKCLENLLQKACTGCKQRCLEKFKPGGRHFERLLEFRKQWTNLHKLDQDRLIFERVKSILAPETDEEVSDAPSTRWSILGVCVCLKAFKRLHCIGLLDEDVMINLDSSFFMNGIREDLILRLFDPHFES